MGSDNRMHFVGMMAALIVVFFLGFALGAVHGMHHSRGWGGYGYGPMQGHMRGYGGMMNGDRNVMYFNSESDFPGGEQRFIMRKFATSTEQ